MSYFYVNGKSDQRLQNYLKKSNPDEKLPLRSITAEESSLMCVMRETLKAMNLLVLECLTIVDVFKSLDDKEVGYLFKNMYRIAVSVTRQRDLLYASRCTLLSVEPEPEELAAVRLLTTQCNTRVKYLREVVLPGNIELTPVKEYLDIRGFHTMYEDLMVYFGTPREIYSASRDGRIQEYTRHMFKVVSDADKADDYRARLTDYIRKDAAKAEDHKLSKKAEEIARQKNDADAGMDLFCSMFNKCIRTMSSNSQIRLGLDALQSKILRYGRQSWVILCCYPYGNNLQYRYINGQGKQVTAFTDAHVFKLDEANEMHQQLSIQNPGKAYCVCQLY